MVRSKRTLILLSLIILLSHNQHVKCSKSVYDFMFESIAGIQSTIQKLHTAIKTELVNFLHPPKTKKTAPHKDLSFIFDNDHQEVQNESPEMKYLRSMFSKTTHSVTTPQLAATHGRVIETHVTFTLDGYILTLHRLSPNKAAMGKETSTGTVLLHHGLLGSSADWILLGSKKSLPYILSDAGYDVWLANARGNFYSRAHASMNVNTDEFWNFSWQEIGEFDLPATLEYIRKAKNTTEPIDYIGHSLGATVFLVLLSIEHTYNDYIRMAILLAPLSFMAHAQGPMQRLAAKNDTELTTLLGKRDFMPTRIIPSSWATKMCNVVEIYCRNPLFFLTDSPLEEHTRVTEYLNLLQEYVPAGGSTKTIRHYTQLITSNKFHHYGRPDWEFNLKFIRVPMVIVSSNDDMISNPIDNQMLYQMITSPAVHIVIEDQKLSHTEFAWGFNADILVYNKIRSVLSLGPRVINGEGNETEHEEN